MVLKSASDQCPAIVPAMARNSTFRTPMSTPVAAVEVKEPTPRRLPQRVLPGFGLTLRYTMVYLSLIVLIPLSAVFIRTFEFALVHFRDPLTPPRAPPSLPL